MTQNKPAEWAMKAADDAYKAARYYEYGGGNLIESFARAIEATDKAATEREREGCAQLVETQWGYDTSISTMSQTARSIAAAIRKGWRL